MSTKLVDKYVSLTNRPIPSDDASIEEKRNWLLTEEWGCCPPNSTEFKSEDYCRKNNDKANVEQHISERPAMLNKLKQDGFIHWLNTISYQCINKSLGEVYEMDHVKGIVKQPGTDYDNPPTMCVQSCTNATDESVECFQCLNRSAKTLCPALKDVDVELIQLAAACLTCMGLRGAIDIENDDHVRDMFACAKKNSFNNRQKALSDGAIAGIVIGCVLVVFTIVTVLVYVYWYRKRPSSRSVN